MKHGVDIRLSRIGAYGQGFYTSTRTPGDELGDVTLTVAVRLQHPLIGSQERIEGVVDEFIIERYGSFRPITPTVAEAIGRQFIRLEYDGLVIQDVDDEGTDYVVAFFGATVKVVQP